ncbi:hypothetical protein HGP28_02285 [Vibrio sp. SM6]|uniref:Lipoprotein n=1 Tax=Vibrio agarilyticus TaxID=2726741 RepID=A0A7X8TNF1_9VIBR|nr:hypothetical protein [Vibrio agarilyticus]NLS11716.1 hypothetical protein [Vibrio agarilyticus]
MKALVLSAVALSLVGCSITPTEQEVKARIEATQNKLKNDRITLNKSVINKIEAKTWNIKGTTYQIDMSVSSDEYKFMSEIHEYRPEDELVKQAHKDADREMWDARKLNERLNWIGKMGGQFSILGYAYTIDTASDGNIKAMLIQDGVKIDTFEMRGIARPAAGSAWRNNAIVYDKNIDSTKDFEIRVINTITKSMESYKFEVLQ